MEKIYTRYGDMHTMWHPGTSHTVKATDIHKIIDFPTGRCVTLMVPKSKVKEPGFYRFEDGKVLHRFWDEQEFKEVKQ